MNCYAAPKRKISKTISGSAITPTSSAKKNTNLTIMAKSRRLRSRTSEILEIYGEQVERLTAKDDKPLSADEAKKEDEKIQKIIDKRKQESEEDRRKRLEKEEKDREEDRKFVLEIADAFNFRLIGSEMIDGRDTWVFEGEPRPGYSPRIERRGY